MTGTEYIFNLREGVTFHNGDAFTADDVVYTYQALEGPRQVDPQPGDRQRQRRGPHQRSQGQDPARETASLDAGQNPRACLGPGHDHRLARRHRVDGHVGLRPQDGWHRSVPDHRPSAWPVDDAGAVRETTTTRTGRNWTRSSSYRSSIPSRSPPPSRPATSSSSAATRSRPS